MVQPWLAVENRDSIKWRRMTLVAGAKLGPYEIVSPIGAGGMGEVYRARDSRLNRTVAIKVLPSALTSDPLALARFEREARAVAALSHPHVCPVHDVGRHDGIDFLVLEFLDGETLAHRLSRGRLTLEQALEYAVQIAGGLAAAHDAGLIHRDIKPGNIMLTKSGAVLLDFGLAKAPTTAATEVTVTSPVTIAGALMGTVQYMAPEQIEGRPADQRSDIFAFGAVLYEMVSGRRAFGGETTAAIVAALLGTNPQPLATIDATVPAALDRLVRVCLEKDPGKRWQSTADVVRQLEWIAVDRTTVRVAPTNGRRAFRRSSILFGAAGLALGAALAAMWPRSEAVTGRSVTPARFEIRLAPGTRVFDPPAISRDGTRIVYAVGDDSGATRVLLRSIDRLESVPIPGTDGGRTPTFSPDGQSIAFMGPGGLKTKALQGGAPTNIWATPLQPSLSRGISWASDGTIVFASSPNTGLSRVAASGGAVQFFTTASPEHDEIGHMWPEQLPDGRGVIFTTTGHGDAEPFKLCIHTPDQRAHRDLVESGRNAHYIRSGHLIYAVADALMAAPFDLRTLTIRGTPIPVVQGLQGVSGIGFAYFAVSDSGTLVYAEGPEVTQSSTPVWIGADGAAVPVKNVAKGTLHYDAALSADGKQAVFSVIRGPWQDLWLHDIARSSWTRLTTAAPAEMAPVWLSDRGAIAFSSNAESVAQLYSIPADGSGEASVLFRSQNSKYASSYSATNKLLAYVEFMPTTQGDIWLLDLSGPPKAEPFLATRFGEGAPDFSPDGRWLAYSSDESGRFEVSIRPVRRPGGRVAVSTDGGRAPRWSRDGKRLFYINDGKLMMVSVAEQSGTLTIGAPTARANHDYFGGAVANYSIASDGRALAVRREGTPPSTDRLIVVQDWRRRNDP
jgi:Tol biopolymer transport system component